MFKVDLKWVISAMVLVMLAPKLAAQEALPHPLAISANSQWVVYGDGDTNLLRQSGTDPQIRQVVNVGAIVTSISTTRSAKKVLFSTNCGGLGQVDFEGQSPKLSWSHSPNNTCLAYHSVGKAEYQPVAISPDGEKYALHRQIDYVTVFDAETGKLLWNFPKAQKKSRVSHLEFLAGNRLLLVVESKWQDKNKLWSNNFSIWDLANLQLHSSFETQTNVEPTRDSLLALSQFSGHGWSLSSSPTGDTLTELVRFPATGCASDVQRYHVEAAPVGSVHLAADSYGRWLALSRPRSNGEEILFFDASGNSALNFRRPLSIASVGGVIDSMRATLDGTALWVTLDTGAVKQFALPREALVPTPTHGTFKVSPCQPDDEAAKARDVTDSNPTHRATLVRQVEPAPWFLAPGWCRDNPGWFFTGNGEILFDAGAELIFYDSLASEVRRLPMPRSKTVCAKVLPLAQAFLTYQGDTLVKRTWSGERQVIDRRPGWTPTYLWTRKYGSVKQEALAYVTWIPKQPVTVTPAQEGISTIYSLVTGKLVKEAAVHQCGASATYLLLSCPDGGLAPLLTDDELQAHGLFNEFAVEVGLYRQLTVRHRQDANDKGMVIFRLGLVGESVAQSDPSAEASTPKRKSKKATRRIALHYLTGQMLDDNWVIGIRGDSARIYDVRSRRLIAIVPQAVPELLMWNARDQLLWVVTKENILQAWQITPSN